MSISLFLLLRLTYDVRRYFCGHDKIKF